MSKRDEELALRVFDSVRRPKKLRKCDSCEQLTPIDELAPDYDEQDRRIGLVCTTCW